jgi:zinc transport system substrate-binding protein
MKQSLLILSTIFFIIFVIAGAYIYRSHRIAPINDSAPKDAKVHVTASFYPLGEFASMVGGPFAVDVSVIVPAGVEPHDYEPTPQDIASIYEADVFIINGAGIDAWAEKIRPDLESKGVKVLVMSDVLGFGDTIRCGQSLCARDIDTQTDPHFWLDPVLAKKEVNAIKDTFSSVDTNNQAVYTANAQVYTEELQTLDKEYRDGLAVCSNKTIVTSHAAFGYLAQRYGFVPFSITGFSPESEPSTRQLADLATLARQKNIRYIFFETLVSPRLAQTLANEISAQTLVFNPLEGLTTDEINQGKDYISVMQENLHNLQLAMDCNGQ